MPPRGDLVADYRPLLWPAAAWSVLYGAALFLGGPQRMSAPAWEGLRDLLAPVPVHWSGWPLVVAGVLMGAGIVTGSRAARLVGYFLAAACCGGLAGTFGYTSVQNGTSLGIGVTYLFLCSFFLFLLARGVRYWLRPDTQEA